MRLPRFAVNKKRIAAIRELIELLEHDDVAKEFQNRLSLIETREEKFERARLVIKNAERLSEVREEQIDELRIILLEARALSTALYQDSYNHNEKLKRQAKKDYDKIIADAESKAWDIRYEAGKIKEKVEEAAIVIKQNATADALVIRDQAKYIQYREILENILASGPHLDGVNGIPTHLQIVEINPDATHTFIDRQREKLYEVSIVAGNHRQVAVVRTFFVEHGCKMLLEMVLHAGLNPLVTTANESHSWIIEDNHKPEYVEPKPVSRLGHMGVQLGRAQRATKSYVDLPDHWSHRF